MSRLPKTISVEKLDNSVLFTFAQNQHYLYDGTIEVPFNSLSIIADKSEAITLRKSASNDIFISAPWQNFDINASSKEEAVDALTDMLYDEAGISQEEVQGMIDAATSGMPSSQVIEQLRRDVNAVSGATENLNDRIDGLWTDIDEKEEVIASALTEVRQDVNKKADVYYVDFWGMFNDSFEMDDAKWDEMVEAYDNNAIFYAIPNDDFDNTASPLTVAYTPQTNQLWFNLPWGNGYTSLSLYRIGGRDGYEYNVPDATEYIIEVDNTLNSGSTNPVANSAITQALNAKADASALTVHADNANVHFSGTQKSNYDILEGNYHVNDDWDIMPTSAFYNFTSEYSEAMGQFDQRISANTNAIAGKQDVLSAGTGIEISGNVISATGGALFVNFDDLMNNMNDEKWDELVNALQNNKPIFAIRNYSDGDITDIEQYPVDGYVYQTEGEESAEIELRELYGGGYRESFIIKNGSEDYDVTDDYYDYQPMLQAGSGISINGNNVISVTGAQITVDSELDETSNNPVANSAITNAIIDDEEVISRAINDLNDRLVAVESGGSSVTVDTSLDSGSTNPVANSAITQAIDAKQDKLSDVVYSIETRNNYTRQHNVLYKTYKDHRFDYDVTGFFEFGNINGESVLRPTGNDSNLWHGDFELVEKSAITSAITSASTNDEVAGAKAVYDAINAKADASTTYTKTEVNNLVNNKFWCGTQAQYDALTTKENDVLYLIHE